MVQESSLLKQQPGGNTSEGRHIRTNFIGNSESTNSPSHATNLPDEFLHPRPQKKNKSCYGWVNSVSVQHSSRRPWQYSGRLTKFFWGPFIFIMLLISGVHPHPGPDPEEQPNADTLTFLSCNLTSLANSIDHIVMHHSFDYLVAQEVAVAANAKTRVNAQLSDLGIFGSYTNSDPELTHTTGGVGMFAKHRNQVLPLQAKSQSLDECMNNGRIQINAIDLGNKNMLATYNAYCWTNGHSDTLARRRLRRI